MSNGIFKILNLILSIVTFIILFRILPQNVYGELLLIQTILAIFSAFDFGTGTALEKYTPNYLSNNEKGQYYSNLTILILIHIAIGISIATFFYFIAPHVLTKYVNIGPFDSNMWLYIGLILSSFYPLQSLIPALKGHNLFPDLNFTLFTSGLVGNIFMICAAFYTDNIALLLFSKYSTNIWLIIRHVNILKRKSPFGFTFSVLDFKKTSSFIQFSSWIFAMKLSSLFVHQFDKIIISTFLGPASIPIYYAAQRVIQIPIDINEILKSAVIPTASRIKSNNIKKKFTEFLIDGISQLNAIFSFIVFIVILFAYELLFIIGGQELATYNTLIQVSCLLLLPVAGRGFFSNALVGSGEIIKRQALWSVISGISFLGILIFSVKYFQLNGTILSKPINHFIMHGLWIYMIARYTDLGGKGFIILTIKNQWLILLLSILYLLIIQYYIEYSLSFFILKVSLASIVSLLVWIYLIDNRIKKYLLNTYLYKKN